MPVVRPIIARSWFRCRKYGLDPYARLTQPKAGLFKTEAPEADRGVLGPQMDRVELVLRLLQSWLGVEEGLIALLSKERTVLASGGKLPSLDPLWQVGETLLEEKYGTIAPILLSAELPEVEVSGCEHFLAYFHGYQTLAVAIEFGGHNYMLSVITHKGQLGLQAAGLLKAVGWILENGELEQLEIKNAP